MFYDWNLKKKLHKKEFLNFKLLMMKSVFIVLTLFFHFASGSVSYIHPECGISPSLVMRNLAMQIGKFLLFDLD